MKKSQSVLNARQTNILSARMEQLMGPECPGAAQALPTKASPGLNRSHQRLSVENLQITHLSRPGAMLGAANGAGKGLYVSQGGFLYT